MKDGRVKKIFYFFVLLVLCFTFLLPSPRKEQDPDAIARALRDRLKDALDFKNQKEDIATTVLVDAVRVMERLFLDSITINPGNLIVRRIGGKYSLLDGHHRIMSFGNAKNVATWAKAIIKYYKITRICFVGRPNPSLTFLLRSGETIVKKSSFYKTAITGRSPVGKFPFPSYQKVINFNNKNIALIELGKKYKIVGGNTTLFEFDNKIEAIVSFVFIKLYKFDQKCIVGNPAGNKEEMFIYLKKKEKRLKVAK